MQLFGVPYKAWLVMVVLLVALAATFRWSTPKNTELHREELKSEPRAPARPSRQATLTPGRVVELHTAKGLIEYVLFEEDCPKTTRFVADLIQKGLYSNAKFTRVDKDSLVKTNPRVKEMEPIAPELRNGLIHDKGTVGISKWSHPSEEAGAVYICIEPQHHLDFDFTVFGRVISGMDVAQKIVVGDTIKQATIRPLTNIDKQRLRKVLTIQAERRVQ